MRYVVLDTETTGLSPKSGHRIIEIGAIEILERTVTDAKYHQYIHPERDIDPGASKVHGITLEFLKGKPKFADQVAAFMEFVKGATLIIHNAKFDIGFLNHELQLLKNNPYGKMEDHCQVLDTLALAREKLPRSRHSLDALCKYYQVDNSGRDLHGALLDSDLLAQVYLAMTGGQREITFEQEATSVARKQSKQLDLSKLKVLKPSEAILKKSQTYFEDA